MHVFYSLKRSLIVPALLPVLFCSWSGLSGEKPFDPIGTWRTYHKDGSSFDLVISPNGMASSTSDNQKGTWRWEKLAVVIDFSDGWRDSIEQDPQGSMIKKSWPPNVNRASPSQNISPIERISSQP